MNCSVCGPLLVGDGSRFGEAKLKDVKESGALGCSGCTLILNAFLTIHPTSLEDHSLIKQIHSQLPENPGPLNLYLCNPDELNVYELMQVNLFISEGTKIKKWPRIGAGSPVPESTGCEASLQQLDKCFKECRKTHPICRAESRGLPRRVIDIGNIIEFPNDIRLYESHHEQKDYICLSYRWPEVPSMQTLKSNIEKYKADIPFDALPLSFQHTLQVANFLRVQYLWWNYVVEFSGLRLSDPADKLKAIKGLATRMKTTWGRGTYLAGLWETHFCMTFAGGLTHHQLGQRSGTLQHGPRQSTTMTSEITSTPLVLEPRVTNPIRCAH